MSCDNKIHLNDAGTAFNVTVVDQDGAVMDLSLATTKEYIFLKPDRTTDDKDAIFITDGTDGQLQYTVEPNFLSQVGTWSYQVHIVLSGGEYHTSIVDFEVEDNLN